MNCMSYIAYQNLGHMYNEHNAGIHAYPWSMYQSYVIRYEYWTHAHTLRCDAQNSNTHLYQTGNLLLEYSIASQKLRACTVLRMNTFREPPHKTAGKKCMHTKQPTSTVCTVLEYRYQVPPTKHLLRGYTALEYCLLSMNTVFRTLTTVSTLNSQQVNTMLFYQKRQHSKCINNDFLNSCKSAVTCHLHCMAEWSKRKGGFTQLQQQQEWWVK